MSSLLPWPGHEALLSNSQHGVTGRRNSPAISRRWPSSGQSVIGVKKFETSFIFRRLNVDGGHQQLKLSSRVGFGISSGRRFAQTAQRAHLALSEAAPSNCCSFGNEKFCTTTGVICSFDKMSPSSFSSPRNGSLNQGRTYARREQRGITSRKLKVGLINKFVRLGGQGGEAGSDCGGGGGGGAGGGGGGGDSGDGADFPISDNDSGSSIFSVLLQLLRDVCKGRGGVWVPPAILAAFLVSSAFLNWGNYAFAEAVSDSRSHGEEENGAAVGKAEDRIKKGFAEGAVWDVRGSKWKRFIADLDRDEFIYDLAKPSEEEAEEYENYHHKKDGKDIEKREGAWGQLVGNGKALKLSLRDAGIWASELVRQVFLPAGYPGSVTESYLEFTSWRLGQIIASQITGVLTTQALLYAVGLGKGAIPTAAAVNWVLKDGIGYLSKILLSKYGRHFDVHPKGWRLVSDIIENASYGLELITPLQPHLFVYLAAAAGAGRSAAGLIQAATKSTFNANFAAQQNFAEIFAKGEAQGMASKSVGIGLGILISGHVGSQGPILVVTFAVTSALHIFFNLKSYQAVHLRTLNPYRASLVLAEYLKSGSVPAVKDVNVEEPVFFGYSWFNPEQRRRQAKPDTVSPESKRIASVLRKTVELGVSLGAVVRTKGDADALMELYDRDMYLLAVQERSRINVVLKDGASPKDMLRAMVQALYFLNISSERYIQSGDLVADCSQGGILQVTHDLMEKNFENITHALSERGWVSDGVLARAAPNRLLLESQTLYPAVGATAGSL